MQCIFIYKPHFCGTSFMRIMNNFTCRRSGGCLVLRGTAAFTWWPIWSRGSFARSVRMTTIWFTTRTWHSTPTALWSPGWLIIYLSSNVIIINCMLHIPFFSSLKYKLVKRSNSTHIEQKSLRSLHSLSTRWLLGVITKGCKWSSLNLFAFNAVGSWCVLPAAYALIAFPQRSQLIKAAFWRLHAARGFAFCVACSQDVYVLQVVCASSRTFVCLRNSRGHSGKRRQMLGYASRLSLVCCELHTLPLGCGAVLCAARSKLMTQPATWI